MTPLNQFHRTRFRVGRGLGAISIVLGLAAAVGMLLDGEPKRALMPLASVGFMLWWLGQLPRQDAS